MNKNVKKLVTSFMLALTFLVSSATVQAKTLYQVIAGSYSVYSNAQKQLTTVKSLGYKDAFITKYGKNYRVQIGSFADKNNANNFVKSASKKGLNTFIHAKN